MLVRPILCKLRHQYDGIMVYLVRDLTEIVAL